jgi:hypothetical protein
MAEWACCQVRISRLLGNWIFRLGSPGAWHFPRLPRTPACARRLTLLPPHHTPARSSHRARNATSPLSRATIAQKGGRGHFAFARYNADNFWGTVNLKVVEFVEYFQVCWSLAIEDVLGLTFPGDHGRRKLNPCGKRIDKHAHTELARHRAARPREGDKRNANESRHRSGTGQDTDIRRI